MSGGQGTGGTGGEVRIIVVDDHTVMRAGVVALLDSATSIEIVGEAGDGRAALELVERYEPDVALVDLRMPVLDGVATTTEIVERFPRTRVLILTTYDTDAEIERGVEAGAIGYLLKDTTREQLVDAIHAAARGETVLAPRVAERLVARMRQPAQAPLTAREADVLNAVADGLTNAEIGRRLVIAEATVKTHLLRLFAKLDVNDRTRAVVVAMERGVLRRSSGGEGPR
ncbi:response regulator [Streptomyces sp. NPDC049687]|uniref:response regulator n=1 Tax=Streptomyces sp. NPDC049687 TaxID=3365596 RepID=UPI0037B9B0B5